MERKKGKKKRFANKYQTAQPMKTQDDHPRNQKINRELIEN